jgi:pimeloyl-ACP methyl ester carboxylesterase
MRRHVPWALAAPPGGQPDGVIVCLHGRSNDERFAFDTIHLHDVVAAEGARWAVAATTGGPDTYWHRRADGTDAGALVTGEFVPFLQSRLGIDRVALVGWSMGGYGVLLAAERFPGRFAAVAAASPALSERAADSAPGAFDGAADYAANDVFAHAGALDGTRVRVDCGLGDPFLAADRAFAARSHAVATFTDGYHDAAYWRSIAPTQIRFIAAV